MKLWPQKLMPGNIFVSRKFFPFFSERRAFVKHDRCCLLSKCLFAHPGVSPTDTVAQLIPDADSPLHERVQQYRQLLDGLPMDAYTHGCILHPELTTDSMIPKYATAEIRSKWSYLTVPSDAASLRRELSGIRVTQSLIMQRNNAPHKIK